ncbi:MAG: hypothetical protein K0S34_462 [Bacillales bacterium]|jgi:DNA-binding transcriptional MerR regulator|nr:hypothetical protein [Bacillales bacterium]
MYTVEEAANKLEISKSALKKYYLLIEKNNIEFHRNKQGKILFTEKDMEVFQELIKLKNKPGLTLEKAVVELLGKGVDIMNTGNKVHTNSPEFIELKKLIEKQNEIILRQQELLNEFEKQSDIENKNDEVVIVKSKLTSEEVFKIIKEDISNKERWILLNAMYNEYFRKCDEPISELDLEY